ncbi:hypothetical protein F5Y16DRAFT_323855 [Xylariaceae sp. FL0255]|nr:hypothetical protein F5Y16DRAFT_323855 [Xylariaceae sp. FL0255]
MPRAEDKAICALSPLWAILLPTSEQTVLPVTTIACTHTRHSCACGYHVQELPNAWMLGENENAVDHICPVLRSRKTKR